MRMQRWISTFSLAAALSLTACGGGDEGQSETGNDADAAIGSSDGVSPVTGEQSAPSGGTSLGSGSAQEQTTTVNDTTPHRPGSPATP